MDWNNCVVTTTDGDTETSYGEPNELWLQGYESLNAWGDFIPLGQRENVTNFLHLPLAVVQKILGYLSGVEILKFEAAGPLLATYTKDGHVWLKILKEEFPKWTTRLVINYWDLERPVERDTDRFEARSVYLEAERERYREMRRWWYRPTWPNPWPYRQTFYELVLKRGDFDVKLFNLLTMLRFYFYGCTVYKRCCWLELVNNFR